MKSSRRVCLTPCNADATAYAYLINKKEKVNTSVEKSNLIWFVEYWMRGHLSKTTYISSTQPKALSASGSSFILNETFIHVGTISSKTDCTDLFAKARLLNFGPKHHTLIFIHFMLWHYQSKISFKFSLYIQLLIGSL